MEKNKKEISGGQEKRTGKFLFGGTGSVGEEN